MNDERLRCAGERPFLLLVMLALVSEIVTARAGSVRSHEGIRAASMRLGLLVPVMSSFRNAPRQSEISPPDS